MLVFKFNSASPSPSFVTNHAKMLTFSCSRPACPSASWISP
jgi:hypothetical protein